MSSNVPKTLSLFGKETAVARLHEFAGVAKRGPFKVEIFRARAGDDKVWTASLWHSTDSSWANVVTKSSDPQDAVRTAELHLARIANDIFEALQ